MSWAARRRNRRDGSAWGPRGGRRQRVGPRAGRDGIGPRARSSVTRGARPRGPVSRTCRMNPKSHPPRSPISVAAARLGVRLRAGRNRRNRGHRLPTGRARSGVGGRRRGDKATRVGGRTCRSGKGLRRCGCGRAVGRGASACGLLRDGVNVQNRPGSSAEGRGCRRVVRFFVRSPQSRRRVSKTRPELRNPGPLRRLGDSPEEPAGTRV